MLYTENLLFSIIGVSGSGKTNYITVMLEELNRTSGSLDIALFPQNTETQKHQKDNKEKVYENHKKPAPTTGGTPTPQIWGITKQKQDFLQKLSKEKSVYTFIIYDGAGEDHERIADQRTYIKYIAASKAIMVVIDPMILHSVKTSMDRDIYDKSTSTQNKESNKDSTDIVNDMADFIRGSCGLKVGAQIPVPVAVIFTKMDALMSEFKNRTVSNPSPHINSGYFDYTDAREVDKDIKEWLAAKGEEAFINALSANFADYIFFGVSSYGEVPASEEELNPVRPHRVLDPVLWFFSKNDFIEAKGTKFDKIAPVTRVISRILNPRHYKKSKAILIALAVALAVVFIALPNMRALLSAARAESVAAAVEPAAATVEPATPPPVTAVVAGKTPRQLYAEAAELYNQEKYDAAVPLFRAAAEQGNAYAQTNLGTCYYYGRGVPKDYGKAVEWYRKAAEQGNASAQNNLGRCYYHGEGVPQDHGKAVEWYRKAAEQGNASAQNNMGDCYY
jgi:ABC-type oligopeptide transport system ATPase subunit